MTIPEISGLPETIEMDKMFNSLTIRYEFQGTLATMVVDGVHENPSGTVVIKDAGEFQMVRRNVSISGSGGSTDKTNYNFRPKTDDNKLFWLGDMFIENLIAARNEAAASDAGSWINKMAMTAFGSEEDYAVRELSSVILADISEVTTDDEIGFQQAADILEDYGIGVDYQTGEVFEIDLPLPALEEELYVANMGVSDDGIGYDKVPISSEWLNTLDEVEKLTLPEGSEQQVRHVRGEIMPTEERAELEILLQRRLLILGGHAGTMTLAFQPLLRPRHVIEMNEQKYLASRIGHRWTPSSRHDTTEVQAWPIS